MGAVTPLGANVSELWDGLISGKSGVRTISRFDPEPFPVRFGGECVGFKPELLLERRHIKRMDRFAQLSFVAAREAFEHSGLSTAELDPTRAGTVVGTGIGGLSEFESQFKRLVEKGPGRVSAFTIPKLMANAGAGHISIEFNLRCVSAAVATACASAGNAMGDAYNLIRQNSADVVITGGSEAALTPLGLAAFAAMKALSKRNDDPQRASRPFDKDRDGFVLSEGGGILVFEALEHATARGAEILAEVAGFGASSDAGDMVQPDPQGNGAAAAMRAALRDASLNRDDIDYINAHGTSTPLGDIAETVAIKKVLGPSTSGLAISSTKGALGHSLGASAGIEAIACINAMLHNTLPPTINLETPDPECDLDYVPNQARDSRVNVAMNNSFGFGGHNTCVIFKKL